MNISGRKIGKDQVPLIIAEIGINHGGNLETAKRMVFSAFQAGCEMIKHQTHIVEDEMTESARNIYPPNDSRSIWDVINDSSLSKDEEIELKAYTEQLGMIYISTPFSRAAADFLHEIDVPAFKIGSGECNHLPLIKHIASFGKPVIMSTGMQPLENISKSVKILEENNVEYCLLECTNLYPSPPEHVTLKGIAELRETFKNAIVGFSDHSIGPHVSIAALGLGASIIERHYTDSKYRVGPDISASMDASELKLLIETSNEIFLALRNNKHRSKPEENVYAFARASVVADRHLIKGTTIDIADIWARRPGDGDISVEFFYELIGKKVNRDIMKNEQLKWVDFDD